MKFQNIKTGNVLNATDKTVIALMSKQADTYKAVKDGGAKTAKPADKDAGAAAK